MVELTLHKPRGDTTIRYCVYVIALVRALAGTNLTNHVLQLKRQARAGQSLFLSELRILVCFTEARPLLPRGKLRGTQPSNASVSSLILWGRLGAIPSGFFMIISQILPI